MFKKLLIQFWLGFIGILVSLTVGLWIIETRLEIGFVRSFIEALFIMLATLLIVILYRYFGPEMNPTPPEGAQPK